MDMSMDGSPIIDRDADRRASISMPAGAYGGFKATPASGWCFAASARPRASRIRSTRLSRSIASQRGYLIDEKGVGAQPNLH